MEGGILPAEVLVKGSSAVARILLVGISHQVNLQRETSVLLLTIPLSAFLRPISREASESCWVRL